MKIARSLRKSASKALAQFAAPPNPWQSPAINHQLATINQGGSVLLVTLFMACLLGTFLFSYLYLVLNQRALVSRSQGWNASMGMAEAGIEEALAQLNRCAPTSLRRPDRQRLGLAVRRRLWAGDPQPHGRLLQRPLYD